MQDAHHIDVTTRKSNASTYASADTRHANYTAMTNGIAETKSAIAGKIATPPAPAAIRSYERYAVVSASTSAIDFGVADVITS